MNKKTYKPWKQAERGTAKAMNGVRTPLSGGNSLHTTGDVIHPVYYVEVKMRKKHAVLTLMDDVTLEARKEGKIPIVVLQETGRRTRYYLVAERYMADALKERP